MATRTPPITRYVIELEPGVWYRDWVGTNRTIDIDAAHVYATAERATRELVRECRRRPYPFARVVPVRLSISPVGEQMPRPRYWLYARDRGFTAVSAQEFLFAAFWFELDVWTSGRDTIARVP